MLRVLSLVALTVTLTGGWVYAQPRTPNPNETDRAHDAAAQALRRAEALRGRGDFLDQLQREREAMSTVAPSATPGLNLGSSAPMPRDWLDAIGRPANPATSIPPQPLLVLVSMAMPEPELRELAGQAARIGAPLILRGLVDDSIPATQRALARFGDIRGAAFLVDPTLFRRFDVSAVPTFILPLENLQTCSESQCPVPAHVTLAGDAGLDHVLDEIGRRTRSAAARRAAQALRARLQAAP